MRKTIQLTEEQYAQVIAAAMHLGFRVSRGRGSQIGEFVALAARTAAEMGMGRESKIASPSQHRRLRPKRRQLRHHHRQVVR